jgi:polyhydroxyalkanoate synthase
MAKSPKPPVDPARVSPRKPGRPTSPKPPRPVRARKTPPAETPAQAQAQVEARVPEAEAGPSPAAGSDQAQLLETLSMNLARAAMTAHGALAEAALSQAAKNQETGASALSPDPFNVGPAMTSIMTSLASRPEKLFQAQADLFGRYMDLWTATARRATGEEVAPAPSKVDARNLSRQL